MIVCFPIRDLPSSCCCLTCCQLDAWLIPQGQIHFVDPLLPLLDVGQDMAISNTSSCSNTDHRFKESQIKGVLLVNACQSRQMFLERTCLNETGYLLMLSYVIIVVEHRKAKSISNLESPVYVDLNLLNVIHPHRESCLCPNCDNIAQLQISDKLACASCSSTALLFELITLR